METMLGLNTSQEIIFQGPEERIRDVINDIVVMASLYKQTGEEHALAGFIKLFNEYLEAIAPLEYVPGLAERLGEKLELTLWDVDFDYKALERLLTIIYEIRVYSENIRDRLGELAMLLSYFMAKAGVPLRELGGFNGLIGCRDWRERPGLMVTLAVLFLILASNP
ncbi:hypothetical protein [Desulfurococcus amylolyticus]|uniref:hypothetical protein n=1 Tax=Desulfurococcus amylolyticus TaxID=94694 RepID=UPI0005B20B57|nr:hypothetical protein [Desulfurococcus amylolyticus]